MKPWRVEFNVAVRRRTALVGAAALGVVAALATGCADSEGSTRTSSTPAPRTEPTTSTAPAPVAGLVADIGTNRLYVVDRAFGLGLENVGDEPVVVWSMQLDSPQFALRPPTEGMVTIAPGRRLVLPLPYGDVRCDVDAGETFGVTVVVGDDAVRLEAPEEFEGAVARLHARECAAADVLDRVDITFGDEWVQDGIEVTGQLHLEQRRPGEPVAVDDAVGNVIFTLVPEQAHPVVRVSDDEPTASVPVTISADRCDPHAVAEFKRPHVFLSWVAVGDRDPVPVELELRGGARAALDALIATCST